MTDLACHAYRLCKGSPAQQQHSSSSSSRVQPPAFHLCNKPRRSTMAACSRRWIRTEMAMSRSETGLVYVAMYWEPSIPHMSKQADYALPQHQAMAFVVVSQACCIRESATVQARETMQMLITMLPWQELHAGLVHDSSNILCKKQHMALTCKHGCREATVSMPSCSGACPSPRSKTSGRWWPQMKAG